MKAHMFLLQAILMCYGAALAETPFKQAISATPGGEVSVEIIAGELTIIGWEQNDVLIEGILGDNVEDVEVESDGDEISIEVELDDDSGIRDEWYANLEIYVPKGSKLDLRTVAVEIAVSGITGEIEIESISGNILISDRPQTIDVESISGNILIEDGAGEIKTKSVSGTITIAGDSLTDVDIESVSGKVQFEGDLATDGNLSVENISGNVLVLIPAGSSARIDLETFSGDLESDFGEMNIQKEKFIPAKKARFTIGSGSGAKISVETYSGVIEIRQK
jgi:DUF4097 and DUF4098 domain-containing protein YvlB